MPVTPLLDQGQATIYKSHDCDNTYALESGLTILPLAAVPPTSPPPPGTAPWSPIVQLQLHAPYRLRNVSFDTLKTGGPPMVPAPQSVGAFTFLSGSLLVKSPRLDASALNFSWDIAGSYTFVEVVASNNNDGFILGSWPFPTTIQGALQNGSTGGGNYPGAVAFAGPDVTAGYQSGYGITPSQPYTYYNPAYLPSNFLNTQMINGGGVFVNGGTSGAVSNTTSSGTPSGPGGDSPNGLGNGQGGGLFPFGGNGGAIG